MSSKTLNKDQLLCLNRILKLIIPSDKHKNLPGADEINIFDFLEKYRVRVFYVLEYSFYMTKFTVKNTTLKNHEKKRL